MRLRHHHACHLCEAICGLVVETEGGRVASIRGDDDDPLSRGHLCPKAAALKDLHEDPDRLVRPLVRRGGELVEVSWEVGLAEASSRLNAIRTAHGPHALGVYQGNPTVHSLGALTYGQLLVRTLGTRHVYSATSADQLPHMLAALVLYGNQLLIPVPDIDRTDLFVVMGADPLVSNGSLMTAPGMKRRLRELRERGGRLVVVDPRRSATAEVADAHHFIRPGTDAALLLALIHVVVAERRRAGTKLGGRLAPHLDGLDQAVSLVESWTPARASSITGIDEDAILALGVAIAATPRTAVYGRFGLSTQAFGGLCQWLLQVLHLVAGTLDEPGGLMFTNPAVDLVAWSARLGYGGAFRPARGDEPPKLSGERPVSHLAADIERGAELPSADRPGVKALLTHAGNPVLSIPNGARLDEALPRLEAMVCIDFYVNETTRHADVILPPSSPLERGQYDLAFHALAVRNTARYSRPVFPRPKDARHDWEIFASLLSNLGGGGAGRGVLRPLSKLVLERRPPEDIVALLLRFGPHGGRLGFGGLSLDELKMRPSGVDLGPLARMLPGRLFTKGKRIDVAPAMFVADLARFEAATTPASPRGAPAPSTPPPGLVLIGRRSLRSNNSWMHNLPTLVKGKERCTAWVHPDDAAARGLTEGVLCTLTTRVGSLEIPVEVTDRVMRGVVSVPHGFGHGRPGTRLRTAAAHAGVSVNDITDETHVDELCGTAAFSGTPVEVRPARTQQETS